MTEVGLTLSRSLGHHGARSVGVVAEPEVKEVHLQQNDLFVIIGTDGLWQYIDPQEAVEFVYDEMRTGKSRAVDANQNGAARAATKLMNLAIDRWRDEQDDFRDDISAVIIGFVGAGYT
jgi:protein phosphatase PTC2/3